MTLQLVIEDDEPRVQTVARRIRGLMGEGRITGSALSRELGMTQQAFSRRTTGSVAFRVDEVEQLARALGVSEAYLYGFSDVKAPARETRTGASGAQYAIADSNREPAD